MTKLKPTGAWDEHVAKDRPKLNKRPEFPWQVRTPEPNGEGQADSKQEENAQSVEFHTPQNSQSVEIMNSTLQTSRIPRFEPVEFHTSNPQKDRHRRPDEVMFSARINQELALKIRKIGEQNNWTKSQVLEQLVNHYQQKVEFHTFEPVEIISAPHDDMMIFKTHEDIIMRYERVVFHKWNRRDDRIGKHYNQTDIRLIDIALISTIEKKLRSNTAKQPIKSFNYFKTELDLLIEQHKTGDLPAALDEYHKYVLSTWEKRIKPLRDKKWGISDTTAI